VIRTAVALALLLAAPQEERRPNIVLIVAQGLGYGDLGCYGQKVVKTPRIDGLAAEGMRWTQFYAGAPDRAVSLAALRTGRHSGRASMRAGPDPEAPTLSSILETAGYATAGFDGGDPGPVAAFLGEPRAGPFGAVWTTSLPAAGGLAALDAAVGRLLDALKGAGSTIVVLTSDGGRADGSEPLRGMRGDVLEGGLRVPMLVRWPGTVAAGSASDEHAWVGDLLPTVAELAGAKAPEAIDGDSLAETLLGRPRKDRWRRQHELYWENGSAQATRFGKWKAIRSPIGTGTIELYDMSNDPGEKRDYAARRPDLARHAAAVLDKRREK
jgi:arylsulfatase A-like enzyme